MKFRFFEKNKMFYISLSHFDKNIIKIPIAPTGVLAYGSVHTDPPLGPPSTLAVLLLDTCLMGEGKCVFSILIHSVAIVLFLMKATRAHARGLLTEKNTMT
jgi:hypothetical protein